MQKKRILRLFIIVIGIIIIPSVVLAAKDNEPTINIGIFVNDSKEYGSTNLLDSLLEISASDPDGIQSLSIQWNDEKAQLRTGFSAAYVKLKAGTLTVVATDYKGNQSTMSKTYNTNGVWKQDFEKGEPSVNIRPASGTYKVYSPDGKKNQILVDAYDNESNIGHIGWVFEQIGESGENAVDFTDDNQKEGSILVNFPQKAGTYIFHAYAADVALNYSEVATRTYTIIDNRSEAWIRPFVAEIEKILETI